ncbi:MAG TPA: lysophospholipid acyltransferase family protein [Mycobacteriales bacterium]|nr:lysophospholipid acyltransferase family protein [Mycobacteriales bacterium]
MTSSQTKRRREWVYRPVIRVALALFRLLGFRFTLNGIENVPTAGGAVLACNHVSYFDFMFVGLPAHYNGRRLVRFMAKKSVFDNPVAGPLMRGMHHIPVDRSAGLGAYESALDALRSGELIGVFPESTISRAFVPRTFKTGAARMAIEADAPLVPVIVWGGHRVWTSGRKPILRRRVPIVIEVAPPLELPEGITAIEATALLHEAMTQMCQKVQRSYPAPDSDAEQWWQPSYLGGAAPTLEEAKPIEAAAIAARAARKQKKRKPAA